MRTDLTENEQRAVRTALRFLWRKLGSWKALAGALHYKADSLEKVCNGRRPVTPALTLRLAFLVETSVENLMAGKFAPEGTCPHCGHPPVFDEEKTVVG